MHFSKLSLPLAFGLGLGLVQAQVPSFSASFQKCVETCSQKADPTGEWLKCATMDTAQKQGECFCSITGYIPKLVSCLESACPVDYKPYSSEIYADVCSAGSSSVSSSPSAAPTMMTTYTPSASPSGSPPYPSHGNKTVPHGTGSPSMMSSGSASAAPTGSTPTYHSKGSNSSAPTPSQSPGTGSAGSLQVLLQWPLAFALAAGALAAL